MLAHVTCRRVDGYDADLIRTVKELVDDVVRPSIGAGTSVLIKPNLLLPAAPEQAIVTHPLVVRAAVEYVRDCGGRALVADSPATGSFRRLIKRGGFESALSGLDVAMRPFSETVTVDIGSPFGMIAVAREAVESEVVINLAKLKTHSQMLLTLGVKNLFGCIVGLKKPEWHLRSGVDRDQFARLLVQLHYAIAPAVTVVDGVLALEGDGPGRAGRPVSLGLLTAGRDAAHVDAAICRMLGVLPERLPTHQAAVHLGKIEDDPILPRDLPRVPAFHLPDTGSALFGPAFMQQWIRRHLLQRPVVDQDRCKHCGECSAYCPASAIDGADTQIAFDYDRCIRCYCCVEICPHGALTARKPLLGAFLHALGIMS